MSPTISVNPPRRIERLGEPWRECWSERGRLYPESQMTEYNGHWYCKEHGAAKVRKDADDYQVQIDDDSTGQDFTAVVPETFGYTP